jgi:hypothetical protein
MKYFIFKFSGISFFFVFSLVSVGVSLFFLLNPKNYSFHGQRNKTQQDCPYSPRRKQNSDVQESK